MSRTIERTVPSILENTFTPYGDGVEDEEHSRAIVLACADEVAMVAIALGTEFPATDTAIRCLLRVEDCLRLALALNGYDDVPALTSIDNTVPEAAE